MRGLKGEEESRQHRSLTLRNSVRRDVIQSNVLRSVCEVAGNKTGSHFHLCQFMLKCKWLDGVKVPKRIQEENSHSTTPPVQMSVGLVQEVEDGILYTHFLSVGKLYFVLGMLHLRPHHSLHQMLCECHWSDSCCELQHVQCLPDGWYSPYSKTQVIDPLDGLPSSAV